MSAPRYVGHETHVVRQLPGGSGYDHAKPYVVFSYRAAGVLSRHATLADAKVAASTAKRRGL